MNNYSGFVIGLIDDLGYCPRTNGACQMLQFVENWYINVVADPNASMFITGDYVYPTLDGNGKQISDWAAMHQFYAAGNWPRKGFDPGRTCGDETYAGGAVAVLSYGRGLTSNEGYSGLAAFNVARPALLAACAKGRITFDGTGGGSPKWDITPRQINAQVIVPPKQK
jgi:hypothetical protein